MPPGPPIEVATILDLQGDDQWIGQSVQSGLEAAFKGRSARGRTIQLLTGNDGGNPQKTGVVTRELLGRKPLLFLAATNTPTALTALPALSGAETPAVGFMSGAAELRGGNPLAINLRASLSQEVTAVAKAALAHDLAPADLCVYAENSAYGMGAVKGLRDALAGRDDAGDLVAKLDQILAMTGVEPARNGIGPVGVYQPTTYISAPAYESLKAWEAANNTHCKLVLTAGIFATVSRFIGYSRYKGENWVISAAAETSAPLLEEDLKRYKGYENVIDRVILTQVVPWPQGEQPIVKEARAALGEKYNPYSLEAFIVGRMTLELLAKTTGELTPQSILGVARGAHFNLGGLDIDFRGDNQGSDLVLLTTLGKEGWRPMDEALWALWNQ